MTIYWIYLAVCIISTGVVLASTPLIKSIALKFKKTDAPSDRKVHQQPMVRLGGVAIFSSTLFSLLCVFLFDSGHYSSSHTLLSSASTSTILLLLLGGSGFFLVGFADDLLDLSPFHRLWMQAVIATALWWFGIRVDTLMLPGIETPVSLGLLSLPITVLWLAGVVNAINWIDGLDGLAAGVSSIATAVMVVMAIAMSQPVTALIGSALFGSLLGFLYYNYNPAKIFMGDGGSYFIGFTLASLCIVGPQSIDNPFSTLLPLVILAIPVGDMTGVILARLYRKNSPFSADNRHLHHRLLSLNLSHKAVVWIVYVLTLATGSLALAMVGIVSRMTLLVELVVLLGICAWHLRQVVIAPAEGRNIVVRKKIWYSKNL